MGLARVGIEDSGGDGAPQTFWTDLDEIIVEFTDDKNGRPLILKCNKGFAYRPPP